MLGTEIQLTGLVPKSCTDSLLSPDPFQSSPSTLCERSSSKRLFAESVTLEHVLSVKALPFPQYCINAVDKTRGNGFTLEDRTRLDVGKKSFTQRVGRVFTEQQLHPIIYK